MKYYCKVSGQEREFSLTRKGDRLLAVVHGVDGGADRELELDVSLVGDGGALSLLVDGKAYDVLADVQREEVTLQMLGERFVVHCEDERERAAHAVAGQKAGGKRELRAAMPGVVVDVKIAEGDEVAEGQTLVVLEAMKMQNPLAAEAAGKVTRVLCKEGEAVAAGALLAELE